MTNMLPEFIKHLLNEQYLFESFLSICHLKGKHKTYLHSSCPLLNDSTCKALMVPTDAAETPVSPWCCWHPSFLYLCTLRLTNMTLFLPSIPLPGKRVFWCQLLPHCIPPKQN
jgi:hypothetical protein